MKENNKFISLLCISRLANSSLVMTIFTGYISHSEFEVRTCVAVGLQTDDWRRGECSLLRTIDFEWSINNLSKVRIKSEHWGGRTVRGAPLS